MKVKHITLLFVLLSVISLVIGSCNMPGTPPVAQPTALPNPEVAIDMDYPSNGSIYSVGELIYLNGSIKLAFDTTQINEASFLINGRPVAATINAAVNPQISNGTWTPSDPGEYYIQAKVTLGNGSTAISDPHRVCVTPTAVAVPTDWGNGRGYLGPCPLATRIPNLLAAGNLTLNVVAAPNVIRISNTCNDPAHPQTPAVTFIAQVNDPQDLVALVRVSILDLGSGGVPFWNSDIYLNWITTRPVNQKEYRGTIENPGSSLQGLDSAHWQAVAYGRDGQRLQVVEGVFTVEDICPPQQPPQPHPGIAPPTLTPTPEAPTPQACMWEAAANVFLRKGPDVGIFDKIDSVEKGKTLPIIGQSQDGQFWVVEVSPKVSGYVTKADKYSLTSGDCSNVQTLKDPEPPEVKVPPTKKPGNNDNNNGGGSVDCSSYTTDSSCNAAPGCSYDYGAKACK